ncbi:DUF1934 domain-containing protein [Anaerosacchariphilus polymeriproducens]|uniref:DUF1934 domain-containing protein n=1 Tax=Anaerosacchariphilus polymeriproducens TaxID=1812858 RepID=A0A371AV51_9FIRM|nr:DUF1934 domain-containing protein [Anaerosacchariphilus polymeriproducens]RDU23447.1 DUF1934 domain-containing protein [Anaerosacchariphilus polymeriproducens]
MTKEVLIAIAGLQFESNDKDEQIEVITAGDYYQRNGKHYVLYEEVLEGFEGITKNMIKIGEDSLDITKKGITNVHMVFEKNKKNVTYYDTPFGSLLVGIAARNVDVKETKENIDVVVNYALEVNYEHLADCKITMNIKSKDAKDFSLKA